MFTSVRGYSANRELCHSSLTHPRPASPNRASLTSSPSVAHAAPTIAAHAARFKESELYKHYGTPE